MAHAAGLQLGVARWGARRKPTCLCLRGIGGFDHGHHRFDVIGGHGSQVPLLSVAGRAVRGCHAFHCPMLARLGLRAGRPLCDPYRPGIASHEGGETFPVVGVGRRGHLRRERGSWLDHVAVLGFDHGQRTIEGR
jgi:hypothetical protein